MPDAVTNAEVEDVLSSIRRLVSEDKRVPAEQKPKANSDRLVLTPALRVAEMPQSDRDAQQNTAADDVRARAEFDAPAQEIADPDAGDVSADMDDLYEDGDSEEAVIDALLAETAADDLTENDDHAEANDTALAEDEAVEKAVFTHRRPRPESATSETPTEARSLRDVFRAVDAQEAEEARKAAVLPHVPEYRGPSVEPRVTPRSLSAKIAVLEEVIARTDDQWEPDGAGRDDYAGTEQPAMAWEDTSDETGTDEPSTTPEPTIFAGEPPRKEAASEDVLASDVDVMDEEALRDLVSDIVRQELQGALGERITRNVRKLVRREIHRALAAQELE
ncbi:hypothetical protein [Pseudosulfitobacter koreensis]|uniref:Glycerol-3-phosphate dehydrogenase n=1 Tax=Pseudosulfitobacter koreensis TaxID=2968472 RepID=A0ABT1Z4P7_9RHOB|nr:hypothetical protein [Pseudosulfitobacter koreense]MCR8828105.1 hypothetical protein [Pseudosulfitobacter koreense]